MFEEERRNQENDKSGENQKKLSADALYNFSVVSNKIQEKYMCLKFTHSHLEGDDGSVFLFIKRRIQSHLGG